MRKFSLTMLLMLISLILSHPPSMAYEREIKDLTSTIAENMVNAGIRTIAVVDFTDLHGNVTELGRFMAEEFSVALAGAGKDFQLVDRTHLKSIAQEHKLSVSGLIDPKTARELGRIIGVEALLTGVITPFEDSMRLSIKVLETNSAKIIDASAGDIAKTRTIEELMAREIGAPRPESPPVPLTKAKAIQTVETENFLFAVSGLEHLGEIVTCSLVVTNKSQADLAPITVYARYGTTSRLYDDLGNEYHAESVTLGEKSSKGGVHRMLAPQTPTRFVLKFRGVSLEARLAVVIVVVTESGEIIFRNIPLTR